MQGGTTFTFVTDGIGAALDQARGAAGDRDVAIAGAATVNQYLAAGPIDELRTHIAPVTLGAGHGRRPRRARGRSLGSTGRATTPVRRGTSRMNEITKYVFSNTLEEATWTSGDHRPRRRRRRGA